MQCSDVNIPSSMVYAYAALKEGIPFANGAPNLTVDIPALMQLAQQNGCPIAGKDFKTGQTLIKTVIAPGLKARLIGVKGWYSTNILGNRDGEVLDDPESFKTKEESKKSVLDYILQPDLYPELYKDLCHVVRINYYPPRGDNKEGWDNIDLVGWLGYPMQLKINFLCRDSILAAPIVLDLVLFLDLARRAGLARHPGMALVLLQEPDARQGALPGARPLHPVDEAEEHAAVPEERAVDHAPGHRVLRLTSSTENGERILRSPLHRPKGGRMQSAKFQPALYGGLLLGVLSGLPVIGFGNCCCCLWVLAGGATAAYLLQANQPAPISTGDGAAVGLLAGLVGFLVWQVLSLLTLPLTTGLRARLFSFVLSNARDLPPDVVQALERANANEVTILGIILNAFVVLCIAVVFSTLGGLIGAAMFRKKIAIVPPDLPPDLPPPTGFQGPAE